MSDSCIQAKGFFGLHSEQCFFLSFSKQASERYYFMFMLMMMTGLCRIGEFVGLELKELFGEVCR